MEKGRGCGWGLLCFLPVTAWGSLGSLGHPKSPPVLTAPDSCPRHIPCPLFGRAASSRGCPCPHCSPLSPPFSSSSLSPYCANFPPFGVLSTSSISPANSAGGRQGGQGSQTVRSLTATVTPLHHRHFHPIWNIPPDSWSGPGVLHSHARASKNQGSRAGPGVECCCSGVGWTEKRTGQH